MIISTYKLSPYSLKIEDGSTPTPPHTLYEYVVSPINVDTATIGITNRDGATLFQNILTRRIWYVGGWDPFQWPGTNSTNEQWYSDDGGVTLIQAANAPWSERHNFSCKQKSNGEVVITFGDNQSGTAPNDAWLWSPVTEEWTNITMDMGPIAGNRWGYVHAIDENDNIFIGGGGYNNIIKTSNDGLDWSVVLTIPEGYEIGGTGCACFHLGDLYVNCGYPSLKMFKLISGTTFQALPDLTGDMINTNSFCRMSSYDGYLFYTDGSGATGNKFGARISKDKGLTWQTLSTHLMNASHARAEGSVVISGEEQIHIALGNSPADTNKLYKLPYEPLTSVLPISIFKINPSYSGPCATVTNDALVDLDIYFVDGLIDYNSVLTHAGSGDAKWKHWYLQNSSGNKLTQNDYALMPIAVEDGVLREVNGLPSSWFKEGTESMRFDTPINMGSKYSISLVINIAPGPRIVLAGRDGNEYGFFNTGEPSIAHSNGRPVKPFGMNCVGNFTSGEQRLLEIYRNRMTLDFYDNGVVSHATNYGTDAQGYGTYWDTDFYIYGIGAEYAFGFAMKGDIQHFDGRMGVIEPESPASIQSEINALFSLL